MGASLFASSGASNALRSDALSSLSILEHDSAWSPEMQLIYAETRKLSAYATLAPRIVASHVFGEANPAADFASRGMFCELAELCAALGVAPTRLMLLPKAFAYALSPYQHAPPHTHKYKACRHCRSCRQSSILRLSRREQNKSKSEK